VRTYSLWAEGLSGVVSATHPQTSATWSGLRPGQTVTFRVTAFDAAYNGSPPSAPLTVTTVPDTTAPSAPSGLTVGTVTASTVQLTWNSGSDQFSPVRHEILVNGVPSPDAVSTVPAGIPPPAVQGAWVRQLDPATAYTFTVRATDPSGNVSATSNAVGASTQPSSDSVAPSSPVLLSAFGGGNGSCPEELWLRWSPAADDVEPASRIDYEVRVNGAINEVVPGGTQTITYTDVLGANTVTIVAVDPAGNASAPSNAITVTTNWAPGGCGR
jgi:cellulose 1,4-beta-cellobiosidase